MSGKTIAKIVFLIVVTICAVISVGCGLVINRKRYKNDDVKRTRMLMRVRLISFVVMLVMLLLVVVIT